MSRTRPAVSMISILGVCFSSFVMATDGRPSRLISDGEAVEYFIIPAAASLAGAYDTQWESDFRFFNPCGEDLDVRLEFLPENTDNVGETLASREFLLLPDETTVFNGLAEVFPGLGNGRLSGSVRVQSTSDSGCTVLLVSRTFNDTPEGTLGLFVPALPAESPGGSYLDFPGLIQDVNYRTNLRLVNFSETPVWVPLTIFDRDGVQVGESRSAKILGESTKQINEVADWLGVTVDLALFTVRAEVYGREVQAVATVVDNLTGDSVLYLSSFADTDRAWLAGVASLGGVNDSQWRTDLWLYNPTDDRLAGESEFVVGGDPSRVYDFGWPTLEPIGTQEYLDVVSDELGLEETRGYIVLNGDSGEAVPQVAARTYNLDPLGGTYGLNLRAYTGDDLLQPGETGHIVGVSNSSDQLIGFRTNLGILNTDPDKWATVRITMYDVDGDFAADPYETDVAPGKMIQFNVFKKLELGDITMTGSVRFDAVTGGAVAVYATEIDNRTQDSIFIPTQRAYYGDGCSYTINPASANFESDGGSGSFTVVTNAECEWQVQSSQPWVSITNGLSHVGSATVNYTVYSNSGPARAGTIRAGRAKFLITQDEMPSEITVSLPGDVPMELACIPPGTFQMGSPDGERGRRANEMLHEVTLTKGYCIGKHEVTQAQWVAIMGSNPSIGGGVGDDYPVFYVKWDEIAGPNGFIDKLNAHLENTGQSGAGRFRLPTEAEWEMAARGGTQTRFSFGDGLECSDSECGTCDLFDQNMWWCGNTDDHTEPVGSKLANAFGVYDMHGNLYEWVQDIYRDDLGGGPQTDPVGPGEGDRRTTKGGSYWNEPRFDRAAVRAGGYPSSSGRTTGFRIARSLTSPIAITKCDQTVVTDAVLVVDLVCDPGVSAIIIAASNITVDLGGHVISAHPEGMGVEGQGVQASNIEWVTLKNGTIENFLDGVGISGTRRASVENLTIRNLVSDDPEVFVSALNAGQNQDIVVKDSFFEFLPVYHKNGIQFYNSTFTVDNIEMVGGNVGVDINGLDYLGPGGSNGSVVNSRFVGTVVAGVLVQVTDDARVADNEFVNCETGVVVDTHVPGGTTGLTVEGNSMYRGFRGVHFWGTSDCSILNNVIRRTGFGIFLDLNMACPDEGPTPECFYATGNVISGNVVTDNYIDLQHHPNAVGNTWEDNTCESKQGAEIPECTAR
jgi:formylglycine-generating enzyme required for sulfatase activity